jgi:hypothetical protein
VCAECDRKCRSLDFTFFLTGSKGQYLGQIVAMYVSSVSKIENADTLHYLPKFLNRETSNLNRMHMDSTGKTTCFKNETSLESVDYGFHSAF